MNDIENVLPYKVLIATMGMGIGGAETYVLELCKGLRRKGMDVYVASNGGEFEQELVGCGVKHFSVPLHNKRPGNLIKSYYMIKKIIKDKNIKLVHAHARIPAFLCGLLQRRLKFRFVTTAHLDFNSPWYYKLLSNWGEASLAVSGDIKQYLIDNYKIKPDKIGVTINGIDTDKFAADVDFSDVASEFGIDKDKRKIVYLSRMDEDRSFPAHKLIECAEEIYKKYNQTEIIIVGGGNDFDKVKAESEQINKKLGFEYIKTTGSRTDVNKFIACADVFIGGSRAVLEAMAAEKAVIVAHNQGYIGIFDETKLQAGIDTNFCCRGCVATDSELLIRDVLDLLGKTDEELLELGKYNKSVIKKYYSVDKMADDTVELYEKALNNADKSRIYDVMVSGYYGYKNHGDDALLKSIVDDLRAVKSDINILVLSRRPKETAAFYGVESINRFNLIKILFCLKKTKLLLSGGGSLIQDFTSTQSLFYYLFVINAAKKNRARVMLYSNGIGPLRLEKNKDRAAKVLSGVEVITLRDSNSLEVIGQMYPSGKNIVKPPIIVTADAAFGIKNTEPEKAKELLAKIGLSGKKYFCIAVRSWKTLKDGFEGQIAEFADSINEKYSYKTLFLAMQPQKDAEITKRIMSLMKHKAFSLGLDESFTVNEVLGAVGKAEFMLGMRLHPVIYAVKSGTPVIGLVYDPKVKGLMDDFGQAFYLPVEQLEPDKLRLFAEEIISGRDEISSFLKMKSDVLEKKSAQNAMFAERLINNKIV